MLVVSQAESSENERRQPHRAHPMQFANQYNQHCRAQVRSPAKFVRGEFRESDYESDYECRIQPIWRPNDSESEKPVYKPVRPGFKTPVRNIEVSRHLQPVQSAPAPVEAFELKPGSPPEMGFAPSPDVHRSVSFVESERNESVQRTTHFLSSDGRSHGTLERNAEAKRLQRVDEMRKRFEQKSLCPAESSPVQQAVSSQLTQGIEIERTIVIVTIYTLWHYNGHWPVNNKSAFRITIIMIILLYCIMYLLYFIKIVIYFTTKIIIIVPKKLLLYD